MTRGWELSNVGNSEGPSSGDRHKPDGQIDFAPNFGEARQDVPYEHNFNKLADISGAPDRVDVPDPEPVSGVPEPFCSMPGQPVDLGAVAPDDNDHGSLAPDGSPGQGHGGFTPPGHPD